MVDFWIKGTLKEGIAHVALGIAIALILYFALGLTLHETIVGVGCWFASREMRDFEVEALPDMMHALGFHNWNGLRPATEWNLLALRHSLSGWIPICTLCVLAYWIF